MSIIQSTRAGKILVNPKKDFLKALSAQEENQVLKIESKINMIFKLKMKIVTFKILYMGQLSSMMLAPKQPQTEVRVSKK